MKVRLLAEARAELIESAEWYETRRSGLAAEFADEVLAALDIISETPDAWPLWPETPPDLRIRRFVVARFPYVVAYVTTGQNVVVLAIAHASREPLYWMARLRRE